MTTCPLSTPLAEAIIRAKDAKACLSTLRVLRSLDGPGVTVADMLNHESAPGWAYWYACYVIKGRWPEAEATIAAIQRQ